MPQPEPDTLYKPMRVAMESLRREFIRCSNMFPPLYHELFESDVEADYRNQSAALVWTAFREEYHGLFGHEWDEWHGPADLEYFGRFTGNPEGLEEFKRLGESAYLVLREMDPSLSSDGSYHGWLRAIHHTAFEFPSPLLRSEFDTWERPYDDEDEEAHLFALGETENGTRFPLYPFYFRLSLNVFTSSITAIEYWLDNEAPLLLTSTHVEAASNVANAPASESTSPTCTLNWSDERWILHFDDGTDRRETWFNEGKGFRLYHCLLENEGRWIDNLQLEEEAGTQPQSIVQTMVIDPDRQDMTTLREIDDKLVRLREASEEAEANGDIETQEEAEVEIQKLKEFRQQYRGKRKGEAKTPTLGSESERARKRIWNALNTARKTIGEKLPNVADYLKKAVHCHGGSFGYFRTTTLNNHDIDETQAATFKENTD